MADSVRLVLTKQSERTLTKLALAGKVNFRGSFLSIGKSYRLEAKAIFQKQQPRDPGLRWPPLSEKYAKWKRIHFPGKPILVRTGELKDSMVNVTHPDNISKIGKFSAAFGSKVSYGIYHDSELPRRKLPRRNFSIPGPRRLEIFQKILEDDIIKQFKINGITVKKVFG